MARRQQTGFDGLGTHFDPDGTTRALDLQHWVRLPLGNEEPHGDWLAAYRVEEQDGQLVIAEIRILPWPHGEQERKWVSKALQLHPDESEITYKASDDRENLVAVGPAVKPPPVPPGGLTARAAKQGLRSGEALERARDTLEMTAGKEMHNISAEVLKEPRRPGRRGHGDRFYAELAEAYVNAVDSGSRAPIRDLAAQLREQGNPYTEPSVRDLIHAARRRELLTSGPKGRAGGRLTDKALESLQQAKE